MICQVDRSSRSRVQGYKFDHELFERLRADVAEERLSNQSNLIAGSIDPLQEHDILRLPSTDSRRDHELRELGLAEMRLGRVAVVILNGGMATRFGGAVKGTLPVVGGRSLLEYKLLDIEWAARSSGGRIAPVLMNSFFTDAPTLALLARKSFHRPLSFVQSVSFRLNPDGSIFRDALGRLSPYSPGHGDFFESLRRSCTLDRLRQRGITRVILSNVDNLGACVDARILGAHVAAGRPITTEVVQRQAGDVGGAPARLRGRLQLLEAFRLPKRFDHTTLDFFGTNTFVFDLDALDPPYPLTWFYVEKKVSDRRVVQLEHLLNEVTAFQPTTYLEVPRTRFAPIKTPADLASAAGFLRSVAARLAPSEPRRADRPTPEAGRRYRRVDVLTDEA